METEFKNSDWVGCYLSFTNANFGSLLQIFQKVLTQKC